MCEQSLYFEIYLYLVVLVGVFCCVLSNLPQYPGVVSGARRCYWLAVNQGVRVLSLTTVREVRFADLAILRAHNTFEHARSHWNKCRTANNSVPGLILVCPLVVVNDKFNWCHMTKSMGFRSGELGGQSLCSTTSIPPTTKVVHPHTCRASRISCPLLNTNSENPSPAFSCRVLSPSLYYVK